MKQKKIIKLNENDNHLSLGNIFRIIKSISINPNSFLQSDLFCIIFNLETIGSSTVNNYCTGIRSINPDYKNYILKEQALYKKNKEVLIPIISQIITLINTGKFDSKEYSINEINKDNKFKYICSRLYTISKNDTTVSDLLSNKLLSLYHSNKYYEFFVEVLFFSILEKVQPIYKESILIDVVEKNLISTNISVNDVEKFMQLGLNSGIWSLRGLSELAKENNPFACFEMASLEFYGIINGKPRYDKAYEYYKIASDNNHPVASWAIGYLYYKGYIGSKSEEDLINAYKYFIKAKDLKCPISYSSLGLIYLNGDIPGIKKDSKKAIELFKKGAELGNVYCYNSLGMIAEKNNKFEEAYNNYLISANLGDSWAQNKIGEFYRLGIYVEKDLKEAYNYYLKSTECPKLSLCPWSKYNLAKYFYLHGIPEIEVFKNTNKAINLLEDICNDLIEANEELIYIYYELYMNTKNEDYLIKLNYYCDLITKNQKYSSIIKNRIEKKLSKLKIDNININEYIYN